LSTTEKSTLAKRGREVVIGYRDESGEPIKYTVTPFKVGKTLIGLELLAEFFEQGEVASLLQDGSQQTFIQALVEKLPNLIHTARPKLYELLAIILLPNKQVMDAEDDGTLDDLIAVKVKELKEHAEPQAVFDVIDVGIDMMGLEEIQKNVSRLLKKVSRKPETTTETA